MTISTKFNPYNTVYVLSGAKLVRCLILEIVITVRDSGRCDDPYHQLSILNEIMYKIRPESGNGISEEILVPEYEIWNNKDEFMKSMEMISKTII